MWTLPSPNGQMPEIVRHRDYLEHFFSRIGPEKAGVIDGYYGCGDSLVRRSALPDPRRPFSEIRNHYGGEDDLSKVVIKRAPADGPLAPYSVVKDVTIFEALADSDVPAPVLLAWTDDPDVFERPFTVTARKPRSLVSGATPGGYSTELRMPILRATEDSE